MLNKDYSYKIYTGSNYKPQIAYVENTLYKRSDSITSNNTNNLYKHIDQYSTDAFDYYKINITHKCIETI